MPLIHPEGGSTLQTTRSHLEGREAERQDLWLRDPGDLGQVPSPSGTSVSPLQKRRQGGCGLGNPCTLPGASQVKSPFLALPLIYFGGLSAH